MNKLIENIVQIKNKNIILEYNNYLSLDIFLDKLFTHNLKEIDAKFNLYKINCQEFKKEELINLQKWIYSTSFVGKNERVVLLKEFDLMSKLFQTTFLKMLEEKENVHFILTTKKMTNIIPTIKSRSIIFNIEYDNWNIVYKDFEDKWKENDFIEIVDIFGSNVKTYSLLNDNIFLDIFFLIKKIGNSILLKKINELHKLITYHAEIINYLDQLFKYLIKMKIINNSFEFLLKLNQLTNYLLINNYNDKLLLKLIAYYLEDFCY